MPRKDRPLGPFAGELVVLFVEDDALCRALVAAQLRGVFRELIQARNGLEGLEAFRTRRPHIVLTDNEMPGMSGIAMTEEIRRLDPRIPVLFITSTMDTDLLVRAINLGICSIIPKPVVMENLLQAVSLVAGMLETESLQRKNLEQELALLHFKEKYHEFQQELAFRKELSILGNDYLCRSFQAEDEGGRREWVAQVVYQPHDIMCGDSYSLRSLPDGGLLVFLADAMGKGLAASLTSSLSVHTFNLQVDTLDPGAPFLFEPFVERFTALLAKGLLEDEVLSLCLARIPATGTRMELAAFGMPPILVRVPGEPVQKLRCDNPPLSAYGDAFHTTTQELGAARSVLFYTDGLNEAVTSDGTLYRDHLDGAFLGAASRGQLLEHFQGKVAAPDDDVTFLLLSQPEGAPLWEIPLSFPARLDRVEQACLELEGCLEACATLDPGARYEFSIALREALLNAYEHGSLNISSGRKRQLLEEGLYFEHLVEREQGVDCQIRVHLCVSEDGMNHVLKATIQDEGPGFVPPKAWFNEPDSILLCGRGLKMVKRYSDFFFFNEQGNAITLLKFYPGGNHAG